MNGGGGEGVGLKKAFSRFSDCEDGKTSHHSLRYLND